MEELALESTFFTSAVRAQLNTSASKPCSYFATMGDHIFVFVKGPYMTEAAANVQANVHAFKSMLSLKLPSVRCKVIHLRVDRTFLNCQLGARTSWPKEDGYFLACEDLLQDLVDGCEDFPEDGPKLPTKKATSKVWKDPVDVVDFQDRRVAKVFQHAWYDKDDTKTMYAKFPTLAIQYVQHVLLSWICGCGADLANRNFFIQKFSMYQVDLEAWAKFDWLLTDTAPASMRTQANRQMVAFIQQEWVTLQPFLETAQKNLLEKGTGFFTKRGLSLDDLSTMRIRVAAIQTLEGLLNVLTLKRETTEETNPKKKVVLHT